MCVSNKKWAYSKREKALLSGELSKVPMGVRHLLPKETLGFLKPPPPSYVTAGQTNLLTTLVRSVNCGLWSGLGKTRGNETLAVSSRLSVSRYGRRTLAFSSYEGLVSVCSLLTDKAQEQAHARDALEHVFCWVCLFSH